MIRIRTELDYERYLKQIPIEYRETLKQFLSTLVSEYDGNTTPDYGGIIYCDFKNTSKTVIEKVIKKHPAIKDSPFEWHFKTNGYNSTLYIPSGDWNIIIVGK